MRGTPWIDAKVRVSGFVKVAIGVGTIEYAHIAIMPAMRRGRTMRGSRTASEIKVERQMVPAMVYEACVNEACTTVEAGGVGVVFRWKYHWETVAAVVARCTPAITPRVQK